MIDKHKSEEVRINCPFCEKRGKTPDTKKHLYINIRKRIYNCFRCKKSGVLSSSSFKEFEFISSDNDDYKEDNELIKLKTTLNSLFKINEPQIYDLDKMSWKITKEDTPYAYAYLIDRGLTEEEIDVNNLRVGITYEDNGNIIKKWVGRILFPFFNSLNECIYIVGRAYTGKEPKYLNSRGDKDYVIYGINRVKGQQVILCEGIISAISAERYTGVTSVAVLGKQVKDTQISLLRSKTDSVIVCLDGDVDFNTRKDLNKRLLKYGFNIEEIYLPPTVDDPDSIGMDFVGFFNKRRKITLSDIL